MWTPSWGPPCRSPQSMGLSTSRSPQVRVYPLSLCCVETRRKGPVLAVLAALVAGYLWPELSSWTGGVLGARAFSFFFL